MSELNITKPGFYRRRDGQKQEVVCVIPPDPVTGKRFLYLVCGYIGGGYTAWTANGQLLDCCEDPHDLIAEWVEPETTTVWAMLYRNHSTAERHTAIFTSRDEAEQYAHRVCFTILDLKEVQLTAGAYRDIH